MSVARSLGLVALAVTLNAGVTYVLLQAAAPAGPSPEELRAVGSKLQGAGLKAEAARYYGAYLERADLDGTTRATVALETAGLYMDEGRFPEALGWLYLAEAAAPGTEIAQEAGRKIVACLERSGRGAAARTAMASRVAVDTRRDADDAADDPVVARAGTVEVRRSDYLTLLATLPAELRGRAEDEAGREELLRQAVVLKALYEKAVARGMDRSDDVQRQVEAMRREIVTSTLVRELAQERIRPSPQDLKDFYDAHAADFGGRSFEEAQAEVQARYGASRFAELYPQLAAEAVGSARIETFPQRLGAASPAAPPASSAAPPAGSTAPTAPGATP